MTYVSNIMAAAGAFPILATLFTLPYQIFQYRKFGSIPWWKTFLVFAFIFYLLCAYFMVILPLPADRTAVYAAAAHPQLVPFQFVSDIVASTELDPSSPASWARFLRSGAVYVTLFNILLTMPLGGFLRYFFHRRWWQVLLAGLVCSLFFEISQYTGLFGLYEHPYRLADVDDLIQNTFGAMLGFWASVPLTRFLPDIDRMNERAIERGELRTSFTRRLLAFGIDLVVTALASLALHAAAPSLFAGDAGKLGAQMAATGIVFMLIPIVTHGRTPGHMALKLRVVRPDGTVAGPVAYVARYALLFWCFLLLPRWVSVLVPTSLALTSGTGEQVYVAMGLRILVMVVQAIWLVTVAARAVRCAFGRPFVMLNGIMTNTRVMAEPQLERLRRGAHEPGADEVSSLGEAGVLGNSVRR